VQWLPEQQQRQRRYIRGTERPEDARSGERDPFEMEAVTALLTVANHFNAKNR
jgi:hypothetical protein